MQKLPQKIAVVTGGRADFGLLANVCHLLDENEEVDLTIIATGGHLSKKHGYTLHEILAHDFSDVKTVDLGIENDSPESVNLYISRAISKFSNFLAATKINKMLVLGDRYEVFGATVAASILGRKVAHIHGGEVTEGAYDEFMRHSITKMSSLHFTSHVDYSNRVMRLGEDPNSVFTVGGLGAENIELMKSSLLDKADCEKQIGITFNERNIFVTFHPETNRQSGTLADLDKVLCSLSRLSRTNIFFSLPNADTGFNAFIGRIMQFVAQEPNSRWAFASLGQKKYFSLLQHIDAVVGNSSSGLLEVPTFKIATINVGDRQTGRIRGGSVIDVAADENEISFALEKSFSVEFREILRNSSNPYYKKDTAKTIVNRLINFNSSENSKKFYDFGL